MTHQRNTRQTTAWIADGRIDWVCFALVTATLARVEYDAA